MFKPSREQLVDRMGKPLTQSLFLEIGYSDFSLYTLKGYDYTKDGVVYPSIKKAYLEFEGNCPDNEYDFAYHYFLDWDHWERLNANKVIAKHVAKWRRELEIKLRANGMSKIISQASEGSFQAAKLLLDRGWDKKAAGRPSKAEMEREKAHEKNISNEFGADVTRLFGDK